MYAAKDVACHAVCSDCGKQEFNIVIFKDGITGGICRCGSIWAPPNREYGPNIGGSKAMAKIWDEPKNVVSP